MSNKTNVWLRGLASALITGAASAFLAAVGISGADAVGLNVTQLSLKQLGVVTISGGVVGAFAYLKQSPIPPEEPPTTPPTQ